MKTYCILGNCQANAIASSLQVCAAFKEQFTLARVTPIHRISAEEHADFLNDIMPRADLFMYQPISEGYRGSGFGFGTALGRLPAGAMVISYPSIQFYGYHATARVLPDLPVKIRDRTREVFGLAGADLFHFAQIIIAFLLNMPLDDARASFHQGFPGDETFVRQRCEASLAHLHRSEEEHQIDVRLHDVITEEFQQVQLFWSPRHPSGRILGLIAEHVLAKLGITPTDAERDRFIRRDPLKLPRYPQQDFVSQALALEFQPLTEFRSKSVTLPLCDMIAAYYDLYTQLGRPALAAYATAAFPGLTSLARTREELFV